jgi:hypothetical protein
VDGRVSKTGSANAVPATQEPLVAAPTTRWRQSWRRDAQPAWVNHEGGVARRLAVLGCIPADDYARDFKRFQGATPRLPNSLEVAQSGSLQEVTNTDGSSLSDVLDLDARLTELGAGFKLTTSRPGSLMVEVGVPGEKWEIEFFDDRPVEIERFRSDGTITSVEDLPVLWGFFTE